MSNGTLMFDYILCDRLKITHTELGRMPQQEYIGWRAFHKIRALKAELDAKKAGA